jgi:hypothetical protein
MRFNPKQLEAVRTIRKPVYKSPAVSLADEVSSQDEKVKDVLVRRFTELIDDYETELIQPAAFERPGLTLHRRLTFGS